MGSVGDSGAGTSRCRLGIGILALPTPTVRTRTQVPPDPVVGRTMSLGQRWGRGMDRMIVEVGSVIESAGVARYS